MVDVVFKKALKEFRINIFNSYSTALAVSFVTVLFTFFYWKCLRSFYMNFKSISQRLFLLLSCSPDG